MNGTGLTLGSITGSEASRGGRFMGVETGVNNELAEVGGFAESDRERFSEEVLN